MLDLRILDWIFVFEVVGVEFERNVCLERDNEKVIYLWGGGFVVMNKEVINFDSNIFYFILIFWF